jgi:hypothetical protein
LPGSGDAAQSSFSWIFVRYRSCVLRGFGAAEKFLSLDANGHRSAKSLYDLHALPLLSLPELRIGENDFAWPYRMFGQSETLFLIFKRGHGSEHTVGGAAFRIHLLHDSVLPRSRQPVARPMRAAQSNN